MITFLNDGIPTIKSIGRGTSEERHEILQMEKVKAQEEKRLLAQKIRRERGLYQ
jgi:hypothetical protein